VSPARIGGIRLYSDWQGALLHQECTLTLNHDLLFQLPVPKTGENIPFAMTVFSSLPPCHVELEVGYNLKAAICKRFDFKSKGFFHKDELVRIDEYIPTLWFLDPAIKQYVEK
jgi:hypothetical protein